MIMCNDDYSLFEVQCVPGIKQKFKYFCRYTDNLPEEYDSGFYINIDSSDKPSRLKLIERIIRTIEKNKYANKIPQDIIVYSRFVTKIAIRYDLFNIVVGEFLEVVKTCNIPDTDSSKPYIKALCDAMMKVNEKHIETDMLDTSYLLFDIFDYNVCSSYVGLFNSAEYPMLSSCELVEKISREDIEISFAEKSSGVISASFRPVPICVKDIVFKPLDNFFMNITNDKVVISYIGTIHNDKKYNDFNHFKADLVITFSPKVNGDLTIFRNLTQFEKFNDFVEYIANGTETSTPLTDMKIPVMLEEVYVKCIGEICDDDDTEHSSCAIATNIAKLLINDFNVNELNTTVKLDENTTVIKTRNDCGDMIKSDSINYTIKPVMY